MSDITKFTKGPMAPAAVYEIVRQQEGKGEYGVFTGKNQITINKAGGGNNKTTNDDITITGNQDQQGLDWWKTLGTFFPPAKLLDFGQFPVGTTLPPTFTISGSPDALARYNDLMPSGAAPTDTSGPLDSINEGIGAVGKAIPILILIAVAGAGIGLFSKFKGLF